MDYLNPIVLVNISAVIIGLSVFFFYNPMIYGCDHISKKFLLGMFIIVVGLLNLFSLSGINGVPTI